MEKRCGPAWGLEPEKYYDQGGDSGTKRAHHLSWLLSIRAVPPPAGSRLASPCCAPLQRRRGRAGRQFGLSGDFRPSGELQKTASSLGEGREDRLTLPGLPSGGGGGGGDPAGVKRLAAFSAALSLRALGQEDNKPLTTLCL